MRKLKRVVVKEEFVAITGDYNLAIVLNQLLYWTERVGVKRYKKWLKEETERKVGETENLKGGWVYKSSKELKEEIMVSDTERNILNWLNDLVEMGFLLKRKNPKNKWDKTNQYRINAIKLISELQKEGFRLEGFETTDLQEKVAKSLKLEKGTQFRSRGTQFRALPEITTENIIEEEESEKSENENSDKPSQKLQLKYQQVFNKKLSQTMYDKLIALYPDEEVLLKALEISEEKGDKPAYILKMLADWKKHGISTIEQINSYIAKREKKNSSRSKGRRSRNNISSEKESNNKQSVAELEANGWT